MKITSLTRILFVPALLLIFVAAFAAIAACGSEDPTATRSTGATHGNPATCTHRST